MHGSMCMYNKEPKIKKQIHVVSETNIATFTVRQKITTEYMKRKTECTEFRIILLDFTKDFI